MMEVMLVAVVCDDDVVAPELVLTAQANNYANGAIAQTMNGRLSVLKLTHLRIR